MARDKIRDAIAMPIIIASAFGLIGLVAGVGIVVFLVMNGWKQSKDVIAVAGLFTGWVATLVSSLVGAHIHAHGLEKGRQPPAVTLGELQNEIQRLTNEERRQLVDYINGLPGKSQTESPS